MTVDAAGSAWITGGSSGIGLGMACRYAARGFNLAIFSQHPERGLAPIAAACRTAVQRVVAFPLDVTDARAVREAFDHAAAELGRPSLVLNSAGIVSARAFSELSNDEFERVIAVNLLGSRNVAAEAAPRLQAGGRLALVASLAGRVGCYGYAAYASSKFAVIGLAEVLRIELAPQGIHVSVICPPEVETPMVEYERAVRPRQTAALKALAGTLDVDTACNGILRGLDRGRFMIVPGTMARLTAALHRHAPRTVTHAVADWIVARAGRGT